MNWYIDDKTLVICLKGRLDAVNSAQVNTEIRQCIQQHPDLSLCLDLGGLKYISSSGIRVLLGLQKERPDRLRIRNVSSEVYEVLETTGMTLLMNIRRKPRSISVDGCPVIGRGAFGTVYRLDRDTVVKVCSGGEASLPGMEKELENARQAFLSGIPTAIPFDIVRVGDQYGTIFELIDAQNCNDCVRQDPGILTKLIPEYAAFLKNLHSLEARTEHLRIVRDSYLQYLEIISPHLDPPVTERLRELLSQLPETHHMIHGDIHLKNIMISQGEMILIDMDHLALGDPVFEFAGLFAAYIAFNEDEPGNSVRFMGLDEETSRRIFTETLDAYLGDTDESVRREALLKTRVAGYLRFMKILLIENADDHTELHDLQVRHAAGHLAELVPQISTLAL